MNACYLVKGVKHFQEKKKIPGWSIEKMKEKPNAVVQDDEGMKNGEVWARAKWTYAGKTWRRKWKTKSWTSTRSKMERERPSVVPLGMEDGAQKQ